MNKSILFLAIFSTQVFAQTVTPTRTASIFNKTACNTTVHIIAPTRYSDNSLITNPPVYDIYERAPCGGSLGSCRGVPWVQTQSKQLQSNITISCAGKPASYMYKGRPCNALDNSVCAAFSYFTVGGAN